MPPEFGFFLALFFLPMAGLVVYGIISSIKQWKKNINSPILTVAVKVVSKRISVFSERSYEYITFEKESGERMEFLVGEKDYALIVEGDCGILIYQGTRFKSFERTIY